MNKQDYSLFPCPNCGVGNDAHIINKIKLFDDSLERLLRGDLNLIVCFSCSQEYHVEVPLYCCIESYKMLIFYQPSFKNLNLTQIDQVSEDLVKNFLINKNPQLSNYEIRITVDRNSFIEKIFLASHSFNDKLFEYLKFQIYRKEKEYNYPNHQFFYDYTCKDKTIIQFFVFSQTGTKIKTGLQIKMSLYTQLLDKYQGKTLNLDAFYPKFFIDVRKFFEKCS